MTASPADLLNTTWAACWVTSVGDSFNDDNERETMAALALRMQHGAESLDELDPEENETAARALMVVFLDLRDGTPPIEGQLTEALTLERVALAYTTLMAAIEDEAAKHFPVVESLMASASLELCLLGPAAELIDEVKQEHARLLALRNELDDALNTGSRIRLLEGHRWWLARIVRDHLQVLQETPELLDTLDMLPDTKEALMPHRLRAAQEYLQQQAAGAVGIA
ncbi:hypothetical protein MF271_18930 (plasmid) [Deinococcus sp. KNUC1210]|uniref:hypothetical protein n=1 Tax=Deinococcus sp. KNUC1210 TaxID=2917691 RepID=UPI001EEF8ABC|nr:hypothetical protein [Deinococcus sp. KNUC1210]ULH17396.1 hypothetical protein MF271_18930 [Deinococcus sp. KNUC1210]